MWGLQRQNAPIGAMPMRVAKIPLPFLVAARADTDHTTGPGQVAITGRYDSRKDSFAVDAAYAIDDNNTAYATYGVTDEKLVDLGLETGFTAYGRRSTLDMTYNPPKDSATIKLAVRQGKTKITAASTFYNIQSSKLGDHSERFELDAKLSGVESLKMSFDGKSKASKVKVSRKLDPKNKLEAVYNYKDHTSRSASLTFKHQYSKMHTLSIATDYGDRKFKAEWDCRTDNGPWTVTTAFPFNASPHKGEWKIKRRFEF